jgi:choline dehydrogenase
MATPPAWLSLQATAACWGESTVRQIATGTTVSLPRGRGLGGSSSINAMTFTRGHRSAYDKWVADGAKGWGFDDLLPYFKRSENIKGRDPALRGVGGPLTLTPASPGNPLLAACLAAAEQAGYRRTTDVHAGLEEGYGWNDLNIAEGVRQSSADAYLAPAMSRPNLEVVTDALVYRLRIEGGRCTGVDYSAANQLATALCTREVVLTAGTIGSAQLLMLSGIGPAEHLREVGVELVLDLPGVGSNLHDHPLADVIYRAAKPIPTSHFNHGVAILLLRSNPTIDAPDLQFVFVSIPRHISPSKRPEHGYTIGVAVMRPYSRGTIRLASRQPGATPLLDPGYFTDSRDLTAMDTGLRLAREVGRAPALAPWRDTEVTPDSDDEDSLRSYVRQALASYSHPVGTCRSGADDAAVVDTELRVRGINGLRVADGSVIPCIPSGNTNAAVYAIAERAAGLISG